MKADLSNWYTEAEAADAIECSVRNVQRYVAAGKIELRKRPREGKKPENVLNPRDVDTLRPAAFVAPEEEPEHVEEVRAAVQRGRNGHQPATADAFFAFLSAITTAIATRQDVAIAPAEPEPKRKPKKPWIRLDEAADASGLEPSEIAILCREGRVAALKHWRYGWRVNRASLLEFRK